MQVFHVATPDSVQKILAEGLHYGQQGALSQNKTVDQANRYLDLHRSLQQKSLGLHRQKCLYMYLGTNGYIHDIADGALHPLQEWAPHAPGTVLAVQVDANKAYLSDLDAFDAVANGLASGIPSTELEDMAQTYWQRIISLQEVTEYYYLTSSGLQLQTHAPSNLPQHFKRVEVLFTANVPAQKIQKL